MTAFDASSACSGRATFADLGLAGLVLLDLLLLGFFEGDFVTMLIPLVLPEGYCCPTVCVTRVWAECGFALRAV